MDEFISYMDVHMYLLLQAQEHDRIEAQQGWGLAHGWQLDKITEMFDRYEFDSSFEPLRVAAMTKAMSEADAAYALRTLQAEVDRYEPDPRKQFIYMIKQGTLV